MNDFRLYLHKLSQLKKAAAVLAAFLLLGLVSGCGSQSTPATGSSENKYIPVEVQPAEKKTLTSVTTLSGKVLADKDVPVVPKMPGKVVDVKVKVGDRVNQGAVLLTLDREDLQKQVAQAEAGLKIAQSNLDAAKEKLDNAKLNLERTKVLYEAGEVSKSQLEQAELAASDKSLAVVEAQVNQAQVGYEQALSSLNNAVLTSPISGMVAQVNVEAGEMASNAQPAVTIVASSTVMVELNITENIVNSISKGQKVKVNIPAASDSPFEGIIESISPATDARTQLYPVKIKVDNPEGLIKAGMFAKAELTTKVRENVLSVPSEAVILKNGKQVVYVVVGEQAVEKEVGLGLDTGTEVEITQGLSDKENVIIKGQNYVEAGSKVKVVGGKAS
ncbi:efflux RND transporter periplasmic adaptor subunit [Paradesulfitobacterium ferrireducens]|uniref:efflux RND transporter periplasmic adaptor subunit n=1 Tax=Paradesulfitobacterium ferrireducens TaxID=2816476 RepID=UPI001A8EC25E|nr:efflux RND transporter periplasmic adaptor subunit [Paradesulfitobacterium ferrireducens]